MNRTLVLVFAFVLIIGNMLSVMAQYGEEQIASPYGLGNRAGPHFRRRGLFRRIGRGIFRGLPILLG